MTYPHDMMGLTRRARRHGEGIVPMDASTLRDRFESHEERHPGVAWADVEGRLDAAALKALAYMEETGGEPDVLAYGGEMYLVDCSRESPAGRRSCCYDEAAREARKRNKPTTSAEAELVAHGLRMVDEDMYHHLQTLGDFDTKTSSWVRTDDDVRGQGGALFGDKRFGRTFIYHNGADSYYASRGFRACRQL